MAKARGQSVFQLRVHLREVDPVVWCRLLAPSNVRLDKLHSMLQAAMGWTDSHLHCFRIGELTFGSQYEDYPPEELFEGLVTLLEALGAERRFVYEYDYGDGSDHDVVVEDFSGLQLGLKFAVCLDGQSACPPEDCGGPSGYRGMLDALRDPRHDEHERYAAWLGGEFDPTFFELAEANAALQRAR
jgi:hypothetical protein